MMDGYVNSMILTIAIQMTINSSKERFVFTVAFQSAPKFSGISKKSFPCNLALVNKQMLACKFKIFIVYVLLGIKLRFYRNYFH